MWRPWENISDRTDNNNNSNNQPQVMDNVTQEEESHNISRNNLLHSQTLSKQCQQLVCNVFDYVQENNLGKGPVRETAKAVKLSRQTVGKVVNRGPKTPLKHTTKRRRFEKIDNFTCEVVRREIYRFYDQGQSPTVQELLIKLQHVCQFPYKATHLRELIK